MRSTTPAPIATACRCGIHTYSPIHVVAWPAELEAPLDRKLLAELRLTILGTMSGIGDFRETAIGRG
jgi:hypothetical protein